ncbi:MAG: hypothetical protein JNM63_04295 [Spirochaetia bacterium]|nr:hypothetical protein [Spirochaetia bacterium]
MRNAPTSDRMKGTWLVGGHRISRTLPWIGRPHFRSTPLKMLFLKKPFDREKTLLALTCNSYQGPPMAVHEGAWLKPALLQLFGAIRFRAPEASSVPTLLVKSAHDRLINSKCSERLSKSLGFPIAVHPTAGHDLALDDPEWLIEKILAWDEKSKEK